MRLGFDVDGVFADFNWDFVKLFPQCNFPPVGHTFPDVWDYPQKYGATREECDDTFYDIMKTACGGTFGLFVLDFEQAAICNLAARQTFNGVRTYGEKHYKSTGSSYCEYRDDP